MKKPEIVAFSVDDAGCKRVFGISNDKNRTYVAFSRVAGDELPEGMDNWAISESEADAEMAMSELAGKVYNFVEGQAVSFDAGTGVSVRRIVQILGGRRSQKTVGYLVFQPSVETPLGYFATREKASGFAGKVRTKILSLRKLTKVQSKLGESTSNLVSRRRIK